MRVFLSAALLVAACYPPGPEVGVGELEGLAVVGGEPLRGAAIELVQLREDGSMGPLIGEATSDERGRFRFVIGSTPGPLLLTAAAGRTTEFWAEDELYLDGSVNLRAVLTKHLPGERQRVVLSPFTTIAEALGRTRFELGKEPTYLDAMRLANDLLSRHVRAQINHTIPSWDPADVGEPPETDPWERDALTANVRYALALMGLSSLARQFAEASNLGVGSWNTILMMRALIEDVSDRGAVFDGIGPSGQVDPGPCDPECALSANTLRADLVRALLMEFMSSEANLLGVERRDAGLFLDRIVRNTEPRLFGDAALAPVDEEPPRIHMLASWMYDEREDLIDFASAYVPVHIRMGEATIDLSQGAWSPYCPQVYKHVNLLRSTEEGQNPLAWQFEVTDDLLGVDVDSVEYRVGLRAPAPRWLTEWMPARHVGASETGERFEAVALSGDVPELVELEGVFAIELRARDIEGNAVALQACWEHVPLAPPLWLGPAQVVSGPGEALDDRGLELDNLTPLLRGEPGPYVMLELELRNGSRAPAYVSLAYQEPTGTYTRTWIDSHAVEHEESANLDCETWENMAFCMLAWPAEPVEHEGSGALPSGITELRVLDQAGAVQEPCPQCAANELRLEPLRTYRLQVVVAGLGFLLPDELPADQVGEIDLGKPDSLYRLTSIAGEEYTYCGERKDSTICERITTSRFYRALISASLQAQAITIRGATRPSVMVAPRAPLPARDPGTNTLSDPLSIDYAWSTHEPVLPKTQSQSALF